MASGRASFYYGWANLAVAALAMVATLPGRTQGLGLITEPLIADLHVGLAHKRSTLTSILDRLTGRGLITRQVGVEDRRTFVINTTAKGRSVAGQIHDHLTALEDAVGRRVTKEDISAFLEVLRAVEEVAHKTTRKRTRR